MVIDASTTSVPPSPSYIQLLSKVIIKLCWTDMSTSSYYMEKKLLGNFNFIPYVSVKNIFAGLEVLKFRPFNNCFSS